MLHANAGTPRSSVKDSEDDCLQAWQLVSETCGRLVPPGLSLTPSPSGLGWPGVGGAGNRVLRLDLFAPRACLGAALPPLPQVPHFQRRLPLLFPLHPFQLQRPPLQETARVQHFFSSLVPARPLRAAPSVPETAWAAGALH